MGLSTDVGVQLWLDDLRPAPTGWRHAFTADEAITALRDGGVVRISLDHDLGPPEAGTGYDVAKWIEEQAASGALEPLAWAIHSANPVGRSNMAFAMRSAERFWRGRGSHDE